MSCKLQSASHEITAPNEIAAEPRAQVPRPALSLPLPAPTKRRGERGFGEPARKGEAMGRPQRTDLGPYALKLRVWELG